MAAARLPQRTYCRRGRCRRVDCAGARGTHTRIVQRAVESGRSPVRARVLAPAFQQGERQVSRRRVQRGLLRSAPQPTRDAWLAQSARLAD